MLGAAVLLGSCGGGSEGGEGSMEGTLNFTTWGTGAELEAFREIIREFERRNEGARVRLQEVPFTEVRQTVDSSLEAEEGPDIFRVTYNDLGFYSSQNVLLDLSEYLPDGFADDFDEALWEAVQFEGRPYGVPHHTDTSAILYNRELLRSAGIGAIPDRLEDAWSWEEFLDVARRVRDVQSGDQRPFAVNWQAEGAYRWLNWLYASGGSLYDGEASQVTVESAAARRTLETFQTWFDEGLVPDNTAPKGTTASDLFPSRSIGMLFAGDFLLPTLEESVEDFEYGATFLPRDETAAADLGGNAVVVTQISQNQRLAAAFLEFLVSEENMRLWCERTGELPTRTSLQERELEYRVRPDLLPVYTSQITTLTPAYTRAVTVPGFTELNSVFEDEIERLVVGGQSPEDTLDGIAEAAEEAVES